MSLTSLSFLGIYFPIMLIAYYNPLIKNNTFRKIILLCASFGLYAFCEPMYVFLLFSVIVVNYLLVCLANKTNKKVFRIIAIIIDALILLFFKYINKLLSFGLLNEKISSIVFPIGLSYFIFKAISYVVDSSKSKDGNIIDVAIYISNFLTIVSGPLCRFEEELPQIREKKKFDFESIKTGLERIIIGLGKKVIIADSIGGLANRCFGGDKISFLMSWAGAVAYTLQIFFDFSGYTDIVIGVGKLFGFEMPENFNYPYMANSVSDFWHRWHISLTKWFTKYIYIPLGGSRVKSAARHIFNLLVVWLLTGIWHGSSLTFIVWAMIYFLLQMLEKYTSFDKFLNKIHLGNVYALLVIIFTWVIFRADNLGVAFSYIKGMVMLNGNSFAESNDIATILKYIVPLVLGIVFSFPIGQKIKVLSNKNKIVEAIYYISLIAIFALCIVILISKGYTAPLYANF